MNQSGLWNPYSKYRDSGVKWLGDVPDHWKVKRLKRLTRLRAGFAITSETIEEVGEYPVFGGNGIRGFTSSHTHEGDLPIIGRQGALCGCVNFAHGRFWASEHAVVATPEPDVNPHWLTYLLQAMSLNTYSQSAAQPGLAVETISALQVCMPNITEQRAIAAFLDRETAKINYLVSKKQRLIELLQEKRAALISHAVTKGLDPSVPMKDSGVEWVGEMPDQWSLERLKFNSYVKGRIGWQNLRSDEFTEEGPYLITGMHFRAGSVDWMSCYHVTQERYEMAPEIQVKKHDILMTKDGSIGKVAYIDCLPREATLNSHLLVIRPLARKYIPRYIYYLLNTSLFRRYISQTQTGTTFFGITQESVVNFPVLLPPLEEQNCITTFLDRETAKLDELNAKVRNAIEKIEEYRTALISSAVTGKIDVRQEVA